MRKRLSGKTSGFATEGIATTRMETAIAWDQNKRLRGKMYMNKLNRRMEFLRTHITEFQLYVGDDKYPKIKKMTSREMGIENKKLRATFINRLDNNEKARMFIWRYVDYQSFKQALFDFSLH